MMNKKRTRITGHIKYALFAPLAIALLLASNISCTSNEKKNESSEVKAPVEQKTETPKSETDKVYAVAEIQPEFPGGMTECYNWISENMNYPNAAMEKGAQGRVIVNFIINEDGSVSDVRIAQGVDPDLDKEALRIISKMPKWKPAKQNGKPVRCAFNLPLRFKLN